ncbi:MAG TPA: hypothetical protein VKI43_09980 [Vicinamibacterales bacterium]|nr:hypothetical protein [Vicinamibacterales bacterium]
MKWIAIIAGGLAAVVAVIAAVGAMLPRTHEASRTLRVKRAPEEVWPAIIQATQASSVPVDVLESQPPHRLVTRVTAQEKNFGGTWTIVIAPAPGPVSTVTITEDGWVANPIFRVVSRFVMGHHATMDALLTQVAKTLHEEPALSGE